MLMPKDQTKPSSHGHWSRTKGPRHLANKGEKASTCLPVAALPSPSHESPATSVQQLLRADCPSLLRFQLRIRNEFEATVYSARSCPALDLNLRRLRSRESRFVWPVRLLGKRSLRLVNSRSKHAKFPRLSETISPSFPRGGRPRLVERALASRIRYGVFTKFAEARRV